MYFETFEESVWLVSAILIGIEMFHGLFMKLAYSEKLKKQTFRYHFFLDFG